MPVERWGEERETSCGCGWGPEPRTSMLAGSTASQVADGLRGLGSST